MQSVSHDPTDKAKSAISKRALVPACAEGPAVASQHTVKLRLKLCLSIFCLKAVKTISLMGRVVL